MKPQTNPHLLIGTSFALAVVPDCPHLVSSSGPNSKTQADENRPSDGALPRREDKELDLARSPDLFSHASPFLQEHVLPDPAICRAKGAGFANYVDCRVASPHQCPHALAFGFGFFCQHPQRLEMARHTEALQGPGGDRFG